ncbi:T9SS type A sorting domain-containing protein [Marinoscillum pacificum]|uniref:T9SS type A sorting domain-containing protein n=1 Tax=Marinoscillum pacificum TaxID=392723 RepID=UPI002157914F|nr:T9SS type A sorting domain-containing protein [Marinoscillum pacificum]
MLKYIFLTCALLYMSSIALSQADKTASNGNWNNSDTWTPAGVPGNDQIILIPEGVTVTVPGSDHTLDNSILIVQGTLVMESTCGYCPNYGSLTFTGANSAVFITPGGSVNDGTAFGGDTHFISVNGDTFWSGDWCSSNCGEQIGSFTSSSETAWPATASNPLPVELVNFEGYSDDNNNILQWSTASEQNNYGFIIERSIEGYRFDSIGFVIGNGDSNELLHYKFEDKATQTGTYYRLKQQDYDGQSEYSKIILIEHEVLKKSLAAPESLKIYPNPIGNEVHIDNELTNYILYDLNGQIISKREQTTTYWIEKDLTSIFNNLQKGTYLLVSTKNDQLLKTRLAKK